mgnify:CR=1 FL=1
MELAMLLTKRSLLLTLLLVMLKPLFLFGSSFSQGQHGNGRNETISLSVALPDPDNNEKERRGVLWQGLGVVASNSGEYILHPSSGFVENGHICGVLGPSGAGKTTLLASLAGRPDSTLHVFGKVLHYVNNHYGKGKHNNNDHNNNSNVTCAPVRPGSVAWLRQHDAFFERLTVKETLQLATFLELPDLTPSEREDVATSCLESLGLGGLQSRRVGSSKATKVSGGASLSGGEMRRLSVALELVVRRF